MEEVPLLLVLQDKAIRQWALYGPNHPTTIGALSDFKRNLRSFLSKGEDLHIVVKRNALEWKGQEVFRLEHRDTNYIDTMYLDGIRELAFLSSVQDEEIEKFVSVLARDIRLFETREDDTVTLFWKQRFVNLQYQTIDVYAGDLNAILRDAFTAADESAESREEVNQLQRFVKHLITPKVDNLAGQPGSANFVPGQEQQAAKVFPGVSLRSFIQNRDEMLSLQEEALLLYKRDLLSELFVVFGEVLEAKAGDEDFEELLRAYLDTTNSFLNNRDIGKTVMWLSNLRSIQRGLAATMEQQFFKMERHIQGRYTKALMEALGKAFQNTLPGSPQDWISFLSLLGESAPECAIQLLEFVEQETLRSSVVGFLAERCPTETGLYIQGLKHENSLVVRDMVRILCRLPQDLEVFAALRAVAIHPDADVRFEVVSGVRHACGDVAQQILVRGILDSDTKVRRAAIAAIARCKNVNITSVYLEALQREKFLSLDALEKKQALLALVECGKMSALPFLLQCVQREGGGQEVLDLKVAALWALESLDDPSVDQLLKDLSSRTFGNRAVKETTREIQKRRAQRLKGANH